MTLPERVAAYVSTLGLTRYAVASAVLDSVWRGEAEWYPYPWADVAPDGRWWVVYRVGGCAHRWLGEGRLCG